MRCSDAPKICGNIELVLIDGHLKCAFAIAATSETTKAVSVQTITIAVGAAAPVPRGDVCLRRDEQATDFKVARLSRAM